MEVVEQGAAAAVDRLVVVALALVVASTGTGLDQLVTDVLGPARA